MKKLFFAFSIIGLITLSSCGAQENCRGRGNVNHQIEQAPTTIQAIATLTERV